jgi:hypothetical protein
MLGSSWSLRIASRRLELGLRLCNGFHGRTIWIADAHRDNGKRFVRANEKLTAFLELESVTRGCGYCLDKLARFCPTSGQSAVPAVKEFSFFLKRSGRVKCIQR